MIQLFVFYFVKVDGIVIVIKPILILQLEIQKHNGNLPKNSKNKLIEMVSLLQTDSRLIGIEENELYQWARTSK